VTAAARLARAPASPAGAPPAGPDAPARLRRLDWRFLLPGEWPGRVAYGGRGRDSLLPALRERHPALAVLAPEAATGPEAFDLVVLQAPRPDELEDAAARLAPGGLLYCELPRRGRGAVLGRLPRLRALGMGAAALHAHHPDFERCRWIVPLGSPGAAAYLLGRAGKVPATAARGLGRALAAGGIAARLAPSVSLLLCRDGGTAPGPLPRLLAPAEAPPGLACVLLTPRFRASAHVIGIVVRRGCGTPVLVAKEARVPGPSATLSREADALRAVHAARPGGFDSVPRLVGFRERASGCTLLETALRGRALRSADARADRAGLAEATLAWTVELHGATARGAAPGEAFAAGVAAPLRRLAAALPLSAEDAQLAADALEAARPLASLALPWIASHGDLAAPNLLRAPDGALQVVDWELACLHGLPGEDLFFALAWIALGAAGADSPGACVAAFHGAFVAPAGWARPYALRYAERTGLPAGALGPLLVACWTRYVAARAERLRDGAPGPLDPDAAAWLRADRHFALWRHAVRHAAGLGFAPRGARAPHLPLAEPCPPSP
jgi:aminoglycoside phosphotransferase